MFQRLLLIVTVVLLASTSFAQEVVNVRIDINNHRFEPEIIKIPAGKKIRLTVYNNDSTIEEFESIDLKREKIILGKSKAIIILAPLAPGIYKFFGEFHESTAQGQIIVEA